MGNTDLRWWLEQVWGSSFLYIGSPFAVFRDSGNKPWLKHRY